MCNKSTSEEGKKQHTVQTQNCSKSEFLHIGNGPKGIEAPRRSYSPAWPGRSREIDAPLQTEVQRVVPDGPDHWLQRGDDGIEAEQKEDHPDRVGRWRTGEDENALEELLPRHGWAPVRR